MQKSYYAIIPANIRYDKKLTANAKLLYGEITALANEKGYCWASNSYFAELYGVTTVSISKWVNQLAEKRYVKTQIIYAEGSKEIKERRIYVATPIKEKFNTSQTKVNEGVKEKFDTPIKEKFKDNTTSFNNTSNNTVIMTDDENEFIKILGKVNKYPLDREKDLEMFRTLEERYPTLDLFEAINDWKMFKLDKPLKENSNPRSQINNHFKKYVEWGKCLKGDETNGTDSTNTRQDTNEVDRLKKLAIEEGLIGEDGSIEDIGEIDF